MDIRQFDDTETLGKHAAARCCGIITKAILDKGRARVILATGASQFEFLKSLVAYPVDWNKVICFHLDEYVGLSEEHPASFRKYLKERVWSKVAMGTVNKLDPDNTSSYSHLLLEDDIDLACIGIGENGHIAFNDPPVADFQDTNMVKIVELDEACRLQQVGEGWFTCLEETPHFAATLTIPAIMRARAISVFVPDTRKAKAVRDALTGPLSTSCPASVLRKHSNVVMWLDSKSSALYHQMLAKQETEKDTDFYDIPGLVDLQVNGYGGVDFSDPNLTPEQVHRTLKAILDLGIVLFLPTVVTSPMDTYEKVLPLLAEVINQDDQFSAAIPGIHIEGPFLSPEPGARGCHSAKLILPPDITVFTKLQQLAKGKIIMMTMAADQSESGLLAEYARGQGVMVALGHHLATADDLDCLCESGASLLTHLGNGIPEVIDRHLNPIWAGLGEARLSASVIADGHHLPREMIKAIVRAKGVGGVCLVSDMAPPTGLPPGEYSIFGGTRVSLNLDGSLRMKHGQYLAGSASTIVDCANWLLRDHVMRSEDIVKVAFLNPLKLLGFDPERVKANNKKRKIKFESGRISIKP